MDHSAATKSNEEYPAGRPQTLDAAEKIFTRRERAVALRARGYSFSEIAKKNGVAWATAYSDVNHHLSHLAKYYNAARNREQIAESFRETQREAEAMLEGLCTETLRGEEGSVIYPDSIEAKELRLKCLITIQKAASGLAQLYGFSGEKSFFLQFPTTSGEGLMGKGEEWIKELSPEHALKLRDKVIDFYKARYEPAAVPAEFTVDEPDPPPEVAPNPPRSENGHAPNGESDGPVSMRSG